jgi:hypothetical protein
MDLGVGATRIQTAYLGYKQGYNKDQIAKAIKTVEAKEDCPILQDGTPLTARTTTVTKCNHAFETQALMNWLQVSQDGNCPICRTNIAGGHAHNQPVPQLIPRDQIMDLIQQNDVNGAVQQITQGQFDASTLQDFSKAIFQNGQGDVDRALEIANMIPEQQGSFKASTLQDFSKAIFQNGQGDVDRALEIANMIPEEQGWYKASTLQTITQYQT